MKPLWERRYERKAGRRYWHMVSSGRPCWRHSRRGYLCSRCLWRTVTGQMRRDRAAHLARLRGWEERARVCPHKKREPHPNALIEWTCSDCGTAKAVKRQQRDEFRRST